MFKIATLCLFLILAEKSVANLLNGKTLFTEEQLKSIKDSIASAQLITGNVRKEGLYLKNSFIVS